MDAEIGDESIDEIAVRTYERGVEDETFSCGKGATAAALTFLKDKDAREVKVMVLGGNLKVYVEKDLVSFKNIWLEGPRGRAVLPLSYGLSSLVPFGGGTAHDAPKTGAGPGGGGGALSAGGAGIGVAAGFGAGHGGPGVQRFRYVPATDVISGRAPEAYRASTAQSEVSMVT